jgi:hypothetical protein
MDGESGAQMSADELGEVLKDVETVRRINDSLQLVVEPGVSERRWLPLRDVLSHLYSDEASARRIAAQAQLDVARIHFGGSALDRWQAILTEAIYAGAMERVMQAARREYGGNEELMKALRVYEQGRVRA